jgi:hypothetical protein
MLNATLTCVAYQTVSCSSDEQIAMNKSLQIVINMIGNRCDNIIEVIFKIQAFSETTPRVRAGFIKKF